MQKEIILKNNFSGWNLEAYQKKKKKKKKERKPLLDLLFNTVLRKSSA